MAPSSATDENSAGSLTSNHEPGAGEEHSRLAALYEVSRALGSSLDLDEVLNQVMDAVVQLTGAQRGFLMLIDPTTEELDLRAARNFERKSLDREDMQVSRTVIREVLEGRSGVVTTNAQRDPRFASKRSVIHYALRSILCVPLLVRGEAIGVVYVDNKVKEGIFKERDLEMLDAFAGQASAAIDNARLYTQTDSALAERIIELETLQRIDRELNSGLDFGRVLNLTLDWALRGTQAEQGWIAMLAGDGRAMRVVAGEGQGNSLDIEALGLEPIVTGNRQHVHSGGEKGQPAHLTVPVVADGRKIGIIHVKRALHSFPSESVDFLLRLADHAGVAIQNNRLHQAVKQANLAKSQFVSLVSHELKVPMTSIRGYADMIRHELAGPITEKQAQYLETIGINVERMSRLVSDLSDITRIETGNFQMELAEVPLARLLQETAAEMQPQIEAREQTVVFKLPKPLSAVRADAARLVQVVKNLLSNANKYTPEGQQITISANQEGGFVRVSVVDTGIGISKEDQAGLFTQFFRADDPHVHDQPGWGLGLHVAHLLVEVMGGEMGVESELGKGSTFWFTLPTAAK
ncbi:MAG: GAF domain-containing protein [Anaerolineales bacterium]|jgi:signal transduction histidine kinase